MSLVLGERFIDVPVQLPSALLFVPCVSLLATVGNKWLRGAVALGVAALVASSYSQSIEYVRAQVALRELERTAFRELVAELARPVILANISGFEETNRLERIVFGRTHMGQALGRNEFRRRCARLAQDDQAAIVVLRSPWGAPCGALEERFEFSRRNVGGRGVALFLPRPL